MATERKKIIKLKPLPNRLFIWLSSNFVRESDLSLGIWSSSPACLCDWAATLSEEMLLVWEFEVAVLYKLCCDLNKNEA